jgi:hypothetical protein
VDHTHLTPLIQGKGGKGKLAPEGAKQRRSGVRLLYLDIGWEWGRKEERMKDYLNYQGITALPVHGMRSGPPFAWV